MSFNELKFLTGNLINNLEKLKVFSVQSNKLVYIHVDFFEKLTNLEKLYLNSNQLKIISIEFQHLCNLKELDLSFNLIYSISNNSFEKNDHLRMLYLNNNNITNVNIFNSLKNLKHLRLQSNNISNINRAFKNIVQIEAINLSKNTITTLKSFDFEDLHKLVFLDLSNNLISEIKANAFKGTCSINYFQFSNNLINFEYSNCKSKTYIENIKNNIILIIFCSIFSIVIFVLIVYIFFIKRKSNNLIKLIKIENRKNIIKRVKSKQIRRYILIKSISDPTCKQTCFKKIYISKSLSYPLMHNLKYEPIKITFKSRTRRRIKRVKAKTSF